MDLFVQDIIVTVVASASALVLVQRVRGVFSSNRKATGCDACPKCESRRDESVSSPART